MNTVWLYVFIGSVALLVFVLLRSRLGWDWVPALMLNVVVAGVLLYLAGLAEPYTNLHLPINVATVATVVALGVPGLIMLFALKMLLF